MPLKPGKSKAAFSHNVAAEIHAGKPQAQALAISYSEARRTKGGEKPEHHHPAVREYLFKKEA